MQPLTMASSNQNDEPTSESSSQNPTNFPESSNIENPTQESSKNPPISEFSNLNITPDEDESLTTIAFTSESELISINPSDFEHWSIDDFTDDSEPSTSGVDSDLKPPKSYDFAFILRPSKILKHAIDALSEKYFNRDQKALILVGQNGFEITAWNLDLKKQNLVFASLHLSAEGLEDFECRKPLRKMVSLARISQVFNAAEKTNKDRGFVAVFSEEGSDQLSFQWGHSSLDFALGFPVSVSLQNTDVAIEKFPDVSYTVESSMKSELLRSMIKKLRAESKYRPEHVDMSIQPPRMTSGTAEDDDDYKVVMKFKYWESLRLATQLADKFYVYLLSDPAQSVLLRFELKEHGDFSYLNEANFISVPDLFCVGQFQY